MALTRVALETWLVGPDLLSGRRGKVCARVPLYQVGFAVLGSIPACGAAITGALRFIGVEPVDPVNPNDSDLALMGAGTTPALYGVSDLLLLEACLGNWDRWDEVVSLGSQKKGAFADRLERELDALRKQALTLYGYGLSSPSLGQTDTGFAARDLWCWTPPP